MKERLKDYRKDYRKGLSSDPLICANIENCIPGDYRCKSGAFGCYQAKEKVSTVATSQN